MIPFATAFLAARSARRIDVPVNTGVPAVSGSAVVGVTLVASTGTWQGDPTGYAYQWLRGGAAILGATASTYTLTAADVGYAISVRVIASNAGGASVPAFSSATASVQDGVPANTGLPSISGTAEAGVTLTANRGAWSNSPTGYAYQWLRGGAAISGATGSTYTLTSSDIGYAISVRVTASNASGSSSETSGTTATVTYPPPANIDLPYISGSASVGSTLTVSTGSWSNNPTSYTRQWRRGTTNITGATGQSYTVTEADIGYTISCRVTATNAGGSTTATATAGTVGVQGPVNSTAPYIVGTAAVGNSLTVNRGAWSGSPTSYSYQWQRGTGNITGATGQSYTVTEADIGYTIRCRVTAANAGGSAIATSAATSSVPQLVTLPEISTFPVISGGTSIGSTLTVSSPGVWSGSPTSYRYRWDRYNLQTSAWANGISTSSSYTTTSADAGCRIVCVVWAKNAAGEAGGYSSNSINVSGPPVNTSPPTVSYSGTATDKTSYAVSQGSWSGSPTSYVYQWYYSAVGSASGWQVMVGKTGSSLNPAGSYSGRYIRCGVIAKNGAGSSAEIFSQSVGPLQTSTQP